MQLAQFLLPVQNGDSELEECNRFLRSVKVVQLDRQFTTCGGVGCWAVLVHYIDGVQSSKSRKPRIDYREVLNEEDFRIFSNLRKMRKTLAEREGVPVYAVFTNEQLARIATEKISTVAELEKVEGIGSNRVEKYKEILLVIKGEKADG